MQSQLAGPHLPSTRERRQNDSPGAKGTSVDQAPLARRRPAVWLRPATRNAGMRSWRRPIGMETHAGGKLRAGNAFTL